MKKRNKTGAILVIIAVLIYGNSGIVRASLQETGDSLLLKDVLSRVVSTYPTVKAAMEAIHNADIHIEMARSAYYPEADITGNYSNMGPVTELSIPDMGTFKLFPENNYSMSFNIRQVIYDFGRTQQNIKIETENKSIGEKTLGQVKQNLSLYTINNFYALLYLQAAINIKDEQIKALNEHLNYIEKMRQTGSATEYQVLTTRVRISAVENQKVDLLTAISSQQASLKSLLGLDQYQNPLVKDDLSGDMPGQSADSLISFALLNRNEVILNQERTSLAELKYGMAKLQNRPVINFLASGGAKNGYVPDLYRIRPNYVVGVSIRIPIFDAMKTKNSVMLAQSSITSLSYESENTKRNVTKEVVEAEANVIASEKKVGQFNLQLEQAMKAYSLAETNFSAGVITNLDLLDTNTALSESRLQLLKARIDYSLSIYRLKAAIGERIY